MSEDQNRSPIGVTTSSVKYDDTLAFRRNMLIAAAIVVGIFVLFTCSCLILSLYSWIQNLLVQITTN